jgi:hypothetical protein
VSDIRVVLLLLALSPAVGLAQSPEPASPPLVEVEDAPRSAGEEAVLPQSSREASHAPGVLPARKAKVKAEAKPPVPVVGRVFAESLVGGLAGLGGAFVGVLGTAAAGGLGSCAGPNCKNTLVVGGLLVGFSLGAAGGVAVSGANLGGRGSLWPTLGVGLLSGVGGTLLYASDTVGDGAVPLLLALSLGSSIAAYELSGAWEAPGKDTPALSTGAWWTPTVGVSERGAALGLTGRF